MATFGERLREEREARGVSIEELADAVKIGTRFLSALEGDEFDSLPEDVFAKGFVRAYAGYLGSDPENLVRDYLRERERLEGKSRAKTDADVIRELSRVLHVHGRPATFRRITGSILVSALLLGAIVGVWLILDGSTPETDGATARNSAGLAKVAEARAMPESSTDRPRAIHVEPRRPVESRLPTERPTFEIVQVDPAPDVAPVVQVQAAPASLRVPDYGVGTGVVDRRLSGESDLFEEGQHVWFWTRVLGGNAGDRILHTWICDGREVETIELRVGASHWRTHSRKSFWIGSAGRWAVEARDTEGRVLARSEFELVPRER